PLLDRALRPSRLDGGEALGPAHGVDSTSDEGLLAGLRRGAGGKQGNGEYGEHAFHGFLPGVSVRRRAPMCHYSHAVWGPENCCAAAMPRSLNLTRADRIGYVAGGIALIVWALRRPSWSRAMAAGVGGWFLYQAYTGTNPMLKPLGIRVNREPARAELAESL